MKSQLFQRRAVHEPIQSQPGFAQILPVNDPAVVNQPAHVEERIAFYQDWVLQNALQDMDWTFTPVTPGLLIEWLLDCPAWQSERGSYFTSTKQRIIKALVEQLLHLQQHATGAKVAHPSHWDTAAFDQWFAGSQIVDKQGNPLPVFHGTNTGPGQDGWFSMGRFGYIYVTPDSSYAEGYGFGDGHKVYPLYAKAHKPLDLRLLGLEAYKVTFQAECKSHGLDFEVTDSAMMKPVFQWVRLPGFKEACEAKGYDAIWLRERDATGQADALLLFNSNQLKSAIGNRGTYDPEDPRITASKTADRKGRRTTFQGFEITVEFPKGSTRSGTAPDGTKWEREMVHAYGHFVGVPAADGDSMDCYLGPDDTSETAYIVNQLQQDGSFDEHKVMLGFNSPQEAVAGYLAHMPEDWTRFDPIRIMTLAELRNWLQTGDLLTKAAASYGSQDLPQNFWVSISLDSEGKTFKDLQFGQLGGVTGISASPEVLDAFLPASDAFIRMPGPATERVNSLTRVMYGSPEYLLSKNMAALKRISGGGDILHLILGKIYPHHQMDYFLRWMRKTKQDPTINSVADFMRAVPALAQAYDAAKDEASNPEMKLNLTPEAAHQALDRYLQQVQRNYSFEAEWILKNKVLNIPPGSHIGILLPGTFRDVPEAMAYYTQLVAKHGGDPGAAYSSVINPTNQELIWRMSKALELREAVRGRYTVGFVLKDNYSPLASQRQHLRREQRELPQLVATWRGKTSALTQDFERWFQSIGGWDGIDNVWGDEWQDTYFEWATEDVGPEDPGALKERARALILEDLQSAYSDWEYKYRHVVKFPCKLYRAVSLSGPEGLKASGIGIYWTDSPSHAIAHWGGGGATYVLEAEVTEDAVDWDGTILANMNPDLGKDEQEIRLKTGAHIRLLGYREKNTGFGAPNGFVPLEAEAVA